jgi:hypothetical protein
MTTEVWTGAAQNSNLNDPENWSGGAVPTAGDTAEFANVTPVTVELHGHGAQFSPSTLQLDAGAQVLFEGKDVFRFNTVNIGFGADLGFDRGALEATNLNNAGILDLSRAGMIGLLGATENARQASLAASVDGFGPKPLSAVIENYLQVDTPIPQPPNSEPYLMSGAIGVGSNNIAIYCTSETFPHSGDEASFFHPFPITPGTGQQVDTQSYHIPVNLNNLEAGYQGLSAYTDLLAQPVPGHLFG